VRYERSFFPYKQERKPMFTVSRMLPFLSSPSTSEHRAEKVRSATRRRSARDLRLECLEERRVPSGYTIVNMGSLGGTFGYVGAINNSGEVVGGSALATSGTEHAFLFSHGKMKDLGTLATGPISQAYGMNDNGEVVGLSGTTESSTSQSYSMFVYRHGHMVDLGAVDLSKPFGGAQINDHGDIIGMPLADGDASLDRDGKFTDLGSLAGLGSAAWGLNNQDEVVGYSAISDANSTPVDHAFLYKHGKMIDLGTLGGVASEGIAINNHGEITGDANTASGAVHGFIDNHGHMTDLGTLGGTTTEAFAINDHGDVVGFSAVNATSAHGFLYEHGKMIDLNSLIPAGSPYTITEAEGINNRGQIAATAVSTNTQDQTIYSLLLNPSGGRNTR
jgi:probable HAF family extracellular repeat protein